MLQLGRRLLLRVVLFKLLKKFIYWLLVILSVPLVLITRVIKPLIFIRFGYFFSDRMGHFPFDVEYYLSVLKQKSPQKYTFDYFFFVGTPCNNALVEMVRRKVRVYSAIKLLYHANNLVPNGSSHVIRPAKEINASRDIGANFQRTRRCLEFSPEEMQSGKNYLRGLGYPEDGRFVCLFVRDSIYLADVPNRDFSYHNYRDSNIDTYEKVAAALAEKGYWVFRVGKVVEYPLSIEHSRIVDYASSSDRSDLLDIWLMANCHFAISTSAGLDVYRYSLVLLF